MTAALRVGQVHVDELAHGRWLHVANKSDAGGEGEGREGWGGGVTCSRSQALHGG
jgi:hypothetical protein